MFSIHKEQSVYPEIYPAAIGSRAPELDAATRRPFRNSFIRRAKGAKVNSFPPLPRQSFRAAAGFSLPRFAVLAGVVFLAVTNLAQAADEYWRTDGTTGGTWTSTYWNIGSANTTGATGWTSGNNAVFTANSTLTFASSTVGNVTVSAGNNTVTITQAGTLILGGVRTFDIGAGATLTWTGQSQSTAAANEGAGIIKNSAGTLSLGSFGNSSVRYDGGFTLNAGTVIITSGSSFGTGVMAINGGSLQTSGGITFSVPSSVTIGGNFAFAGTGNDIWNPTVGLGASTRMITNNTTGTATRTFSGIISGGSGAGITFTGTGGSGGIVLNNANTYSGDTTISAGKLVLSGSGSIAGSPNIIIASGATFDVSGLTTALTLAGGQGIKATGTTSAGIIAVSATDGLTTAANSPLVFTAFNGSIAPLALSGTGTLALQSGNPVTVTVANGGTSLAGGADYKLIAKGTSGTVSGIPTSVTVNGDVASGSTASLVITSGELFLHLIAPVSSTKVQVETAADGNGTAVTAQNITAGNSITVYAIQRNISDSSFVANVATDVGGWTLPTKTGGVVNGDLVAAGDRKSAVFTGHLIGTATIRATVTGSTSVDSGLQTVVAGTATQVGVETAANGSGTVVPTQNVFVGNPLTVFAITRDAQGNFVANVTADAWSLPTTSGGVGSGDLVPGSPATSAIFTGHSVGGTATIHVTSGVLTATDSGTLTVVASTKKWDGNGGSSGAWSTSVNWNPDGVPTSGYDDIVIDTSILANGIPTSITISTAIAAQTITFASGFNGTSTTTIGSSSSSAKVLAVGGPGTGANPLIQVNSTSGTITFQPQNGGVGNLSIALGTSGSISVASGATLVLTTVISETSGGTTLTKGGNGKLVLGGADTYSGNTTVNAGTLQVDGSLAAGSAVTVSSGTLSGSGTINGATTVNGTLSPGNSSIAILTFGSSLTLAGTASMDINKNGSTFTADKAAVTGTLTYGGALTVSASGNTLTGGEVFDLFTASGFSGSFTTLNLPALGTGLNWNTTKLAVDGTISVNRAPTASSLTLGATKNTPATFPLAKYAADADGDSLLVSFGSFTSGGSPSGGSANYAGGTVTYTPATDFTGTETFNYVVTDPSGASASGTVTVTVSAPTGSGANILSMSYNSGTQKATITFAGIPGAIYQLQVSTDLSTWTPVTTEEYGNGNITLPSSGQTTVTQDSAPSSGAYYRTKYISGP
jgi:fibronectin-binding autotransporter adhesin